MQRRSSQSKTQLKNFSGFLFSTAWVTSLTATIFFPFISSFHRLSSNIWNSYNIHRHIFIFPGYIMNQLNSELHEYENLVPWVPLWGSEWMYFWNSRKYSSATTTKVHFHIELKWVTHLQISSHSNTWNLWNALWASLS